MLTTGYITGASLYGPVVRLSSPLLSSLRDALDGFHVCAIFRKTDHIGLQNTLDISGFSCMIQMVRGISVGGQRLSFCLSKVTGRKGTQKKKNNSLGKKLPESWVKVESTWSLMQLRPVCLSLKISGRNMETASPLQCRSSTYRQLFWSY